MSGISTSGGSGDVTLAGNNAFTGTNSFDTNRPTSTIATTPGSTNLITKQNADALYAAISVDGDVKLDGNPNTFTGTNTFNTNRPTSTLTDAPGSTDFITKQNADALYVDLPNAQNITGYKTFNGLASSNVNITGGSITTTTGFTATGTNTSFLTGAVITNNCIIGSSTITARCPLDVMGGGGQTASSTGGATSLRSYFQKGYNSVGSGGGGFADYSIFAQKSIGSGAFFLSTNGTFTASDTRIKKDVKTIDEAEALEKIRKLRPVNYKYIDDRTHGTTIQTGFIAQEINEILPTSIKLMEKYIPNIYECVKVSDTHTITFTKSTPLKVGDMLEFYGCYNVPNATTITEVINDTTIKIKEDLSNEFCDMSGNKGGDCLFCYGVLIKDYQHLKYDEVFTTLLSAVKLMDKRITELEAQINKI